MIDWKNPCASFEQACDELVDVVFSDHKRPSKWRQDSVDHRWFRGMTAFHPRWQKFLAKEMAFFDPGLFVGDRFAAGAFVVPVEDDTGGGSAAAMVSVAPVAGVPRGRGHSWPCIEFARKATVAKYGDGRGFSSVRYFGRQKNGQILDLSLRERRPTLVGDTDLRHLMFAASEAFSMRYEWQILIGREDSASLSMVASREAITEAFKLRDIPDGKTRRSALRNLVASHWRRRSTDAEMRDHVREHLRGQTKFTWHGLTCEVVPPKYDVERIGSKDAEGSR